MQPIFGFAIYLVLSIGVAVVAWKRGRSGMLFLLSCLAGGFGMVVLVSNAGGDGAGAAVGAFLVPIVALFIVLSMGKSEDLAVELGAHGDYKKCPLCAEPIRKEAIKCKHCGSDLEVKAKSDPVL